MNIVTTTLAALLVATPVSLARAEEAEPFYKGKTITLVIGFSPGGSYDLFARLLARHISAHIPGAPTVVPQSMPGAGSFTAANYLARVAPKDGTAIGVVTQTLAIEEALKTRGVQYKATAFNWIGRATSNVELTVVSTRSPAKTVEDATRMDVPIATTGAGSPSEGYHKLLNATLGTRFRLIGPYPGSTDGLLAMDRGETDGAFAAWNTLNVARHDWIVDKKVNVFVQYALQRLPELSAVPTMVELAKNDDDRAMFAFYTSGSEIGRSFLAPPGVPAERVAILRKAFDEAMRDPELIGEIERANLDFHPASGEKLQQLVADAASVSPAVVARMQGILGR